MNIQVDVSYFDNPLSFGLNTRLLQSISGVEENMRKRLAVYDYFLFLMKETKL